MKAVVSRTYGGPEVLAVEDIDLPTMADDAVLVRVHAASVNAYDWHMLRGLPYLARLSEGLRKPKSAATGVDAAGIVEAVGSGVTDLTAGDRVFGGRNGAFAEYVSGRTFVAMPAGLTFEQAASLPMAGCTALQAVRDKAKVEPGQRVLVTGAGGGVGVFAVQIARVYGGVVTAETSPQKVDLVHSLGAVRVVERTKEGVADGANRYDVVIDAGGGRPLGDLCRLLTPRGTVVLVAPGRGQWVGPVATLVHAVVRSTLGRQRLTPFLAHTTKDDLRVLADLVESGKMRVVVDRTYSLDDVGEAIRRVELGQAAGKVVVTV